jgi:hypothetical protein
MQQHACHMAQLHSLPQLLLLQLLPLNRVPSSDTESAILSRNKTLMQ